MGARVEAFDTRDVVEEQVQSLGAKFVKIDLGETGQNEQGYANELTPEQIQKQKDLQSKVCERSDIVITTAQLCSSYDNIRPFTYLRLKILLFLNLFWG